MRSVLFPFFLLQGATLFFAADGVDTTWMDITDACSGYRKSSLTITTDSKGTTLLTKGKELPCRYHLGSPQRVPLGVGLEVGKNGGE